MSGLQIFSKAVKTNLLNSYKILRTQRDFSSTQLVEIGHFEAPKTMPNERYEAGQLFVHKLFAYRGIVLFPWYARVLDRDVSELNALELIGSRQRSYNRMSYYYQVLIDTRDRAFLKNFTQFEAVTFLGNAHTEHGIYSLPGMDYVAHEDILPFTSNAKHSLNHELFDNFFTCEPGKDSCFLGTETLKAWRKKNSSWLDLSQVYKQSTNDVRVTAIPFYIGYQKTKKSKKKYWWRYQIRLENYNKFQMQLRSHHWRIFSSSGLVEMVQGHGVVGQEPFLCKKYPTFQYNSHVNLYSSKGHMWGTYQLEKENGKKFDCHIPLFILESKDSRDEIYYDINL